MATEKRLIDANAFAGCLERMTKTAYPNLFPGLLEAIDYVKDFPTVDTVEVSSLGELGRRMMPHEGCPRGPMGTKGETDGPVRIMELDSITDVDGNRWIPVLADDLEVLKKSAEVVHGEWVDRYGGIYANPLYECSECKERALYDALWKQNLTDYCPNCGAKMDGDGNG